MLFSAPRSGRRQPALPRSVHRLALAALLQHRRRSLPPNARSGTVERPLPCQSPPKLSELSRIGGWVKRVLQSPWILPPLYIVVYIWLLFHELHRTAPLTRTDIFFVAFGVASIFFNLLIIFVLLIMQAIKVQAESQAAMLREQTAIDRDLVTVIGLLRDQLDIVVRHIRGEAPTEPTEPKP
jgi:hypothetical protein